MMAVAHRAAILLLSLLAGTFMVWPSSITPSADAVAPPASSPASAAPNYDCETPPPAGMIDGTKVPVVLVHGWTGQPMDKTAALLQRPGDGRQYLPFDYSDSATAWADDDRIAGCLADYISEVSAAHAAEGGDGKVFLLAHSMGGLALRFAIGRQPGLSARVGGVVTLDTPYQGSMWGDSFPAHGLSAFKTGFGTAFPADDARAWHCLAGGPRKQLPTDCARAPALDPEIPLVQIAGEVTVRRTLFGFTAYELDLASDGIVGTDSEHGSRDARGHIGPNQTDKPLVSCTVNTADLGWKGPSAALSILSDNMLLDLYSGKIGTGYAASALTTIGTLMRYAGCSHSNITDDTDGLRQADAALTRVIARGQELTDVSQLRKLKIPATCTHPSEVIAGSQKHYGSTSGFAEVQVDEAVFGDITGDGRSDAVVPMGCSAGGVSWPEQLLVYGPGVRLLGAVDLGEIDYPQEHSDAVDLTYADGEIDVAFTTYEGANFNVADYRGKLEWDRSRPAFDYGGGALTVTYNGDSTFGLGPGIVSEPDAADLWLDPAPADFRTFVQRLWSETPTSPGCPATISVDRYSHLGFAVGNVSGCGGYEAVWARSSAGWGEVWGGQDIAECKSLSSQATEAFTALGLECANTSGGYTTGVLGQEWPTSGQ